MILLDCQQNTKEWHDARLGIPTASMFSKIITPKGVKSSSAKEYRMGLHAEWLAGEHLEDENYQSFAMMRGFHLQPQALDFYAMHRELDVREVGFCFLDDRRLVGCSPDGLVGDDGGLEIKCPMGAAHARFLLTGELPTKYVTQVQGSLWITGRKWWDFCSYHPSMPSHVIRVERDEEYVGKLSTAVEDFVEQLQAERKTLAERGFGVAS